MSKHTPIMSSKSVALQRRNEELEQKVAELERAKAARSSAAATAGTSSNSIAIHLRNLELEQRVKELEEKKSMSASRSTAGPGVGGLSPGSQAVQQRNRELEQKVKELEEKKSMSASRALSSASVALQRHNQELEQKLAMLDLTKRVGKAPGALSTVRSGVAHGGPVDSLPLLKETEMNARLMQLKKLLSKAQEVDLAFLVDATYSMQPYIDKVKDIVPEIAVGVKKAFPKMKLRVAFAPYRDYDEKTRDDEEVCDFTNSFDGRESTFVTSVSRVQAYGGGDSAEDVFSGLERIVSLNWASKTRVLVHIADAPCHGTQFHDFDGNDDHPNGDLYGRDINKLLDVLRHDRQIMCYLFCHVNDSTKKMMQVFRKKAPQGRWIQEQKLTNMDKFLEYVINTSCDSISQSMQVAGVNQPTVCKFVPQTVKEGKPNWNLISNNPQLATQIRYKLPDTLEELFHILDKNASLEEQNMPYIRVQIASYPFTDSGMIRWPYHALVDGSSYSPREMVVKRFKTPIGEDLNKVHSREAYCQQMEVQTVASQMAKEFNSELSRISGLDDCNYKTVQFTMVSILQVGLTFYNMEKYLEGDWIRYSNNLDYVNTKEYAATLHAFSHWTHQRSEGRLMVTDLQGVQTKMWNGRREFWLCDPAVHCRNPFRYERTKTNWSTPGMDKFFETHQCNNICRSLRLKPKSASFTLQGTQLK